MENLHNNSHIQIIKKIFGHGLSKTKKQINYKSQQNKSQKPNNLYPIFTSNLRVLCPSQMTQPYNTETTHMLLITPSTHQLVLPATWINQCLQPMKIFYFFKELLLFNTTCGKFLIFLNDRILLIFNILLTLGHTWHACLNIIHV